MLGSFALRSLIAVILALSATAIAGDAHAQNRRAAVRFTSAGAHDTSFNNTNLDGGPGRFVQSGPNGTLFTSAARSGSNSVFAGSQGTAFLVQRLTSAGRPDPFFGSNGVVTADFSAIPGVTQAMAYSVAVDALGGVIAAGVVIQNGFLKVGVARFLSDGAPNTLFGNGTGLVVTQVTPNAHSGATSVRISGNNILVGGYTIGHNVFAIRYSATGQLDTTFGNASPKDGMARITPPQGLSSPLVRGMAVDNNGRILLGGSGNVSGQDVFAVWRLTSAGMPDTAFSGDGAAFFWPGVTAAAEAIAADGNRVVLAGHAGVTSRQVALLRVDANGNVDTTFGSSGWRLHDFSGTNDEAAYAVIVGSSSSIIITGGASNGRIFLSRYNASGTNLSLNFVDVAAGSSEQGRGVFIDGSGRFVVGGMVSP